MTVPDHPKSARRGGQVGVETHFSPLKVVCLLSFHNYLLGKRTHPTLGEREIIFESALVGVMLVTVDLQMQNQ